MTISMGVVKRFKGLVQAATTTGNHSLHYRAFEPVYRFFSDKEDAILLPYTHRLKQLHKHYLSCYSDQPCSQAQRPGNKAIW